MVVRLAAVTSAAPDLPPVAGSALGEAVLRPVRGHHAFEACVEQLATMIRLGVYPVIVRDRSALASAR